MRCLRDFAGPERKPVVEVGHRPIFCIPDGDGALNATREKLTAILEPSIEAMGFELTDLELNLGHGHGVLRLFIDREEGISLGDCEAVSRQVSGLLDVEDPIAVEYRLEVSSPGLDRKLVKPEHFDRFVGRQIKTRLKRLIEGRRRVKGQLLARTGETVVVQSESETISISLDDIEVARLVPEL
jgi:ribosome maturation factor RimP